MAKKHSVFFCKNCGAESAKWLGKCPSCGEWNTYVEEIVSTSAGKTIKSAKRSQEKPIPVSQIERGKEERIELPDPEINRVLGGGLVPGSLVLLGGEPGIGKSTLLLQIALKLSGVKTLYISGEESAQQIKLRADRIEKSPGECQVFTATSIQQILPEIENIQPDIIVVDSVQTLYTEHIDNAPGSVTQIRESTSELMKLAKVTGKPIFLIGHITKDGTIAGPKLLEHMVDVVLQFEGDRNHVFRILRTLKNRYGSTHEIGIYRMNAGGLEAVLKPSEILISDVDEVLSGIAISATMEGVRPLLIEVQALVSSAVYGTPQRSATGFDYRRLNMLLAILEKRCGFKLSQKDVFLNIAGGIRVDDPAIDLAVVCAILSSSEDLAIDSQTAFAAEIGLSGEIRPVSRVEQRVDEAEKMGFERIFVSKYNKGELKKAKQSDRNSEDRQDRRSIPYLVWIIMLRLPKIVEQYYADLIWRMPEGEKVIYLTFDDGPTPQITSWVLDELARFNARATFFCLGKNVRNHPKLYKRILDEGHKTGNHTYDHKKGWSVRNFNYIKSVMKCKEHVDSDLFRPPYGRIKKTQIRALKKHFRIVMWDVLSEDYNSSRTGDECLQNVINQSKDGSIIVFHDSVKASRNLKYALPKTLEFFGNSGYDFKAID